MEIKACTYHDKNDTIDILVTDSSKISILCAAMEDNLHTRFKLVWHKGNEQSTYAELAVRSSLQNFLDQYAENYDRRQEAIKTIYRVF